MLRASGGAQSSVFLTLSVARPAFFLAVPLALSARPRSFIRLLDVRPPQASFSRPFALSLRAPMSTPFSGCGTDTRAQIRETRAGGPLTVPGGRSAQGWLSTEDRQGASSREKRIRRKGKAKDVLDTGWVARTTPCGRDSPGGSARTAFELGSGL